MNRRNRLSAATMLALLTPVLVADQFAHAAVPKQDDETPAQEVAVIEQEHARLSYPAVNVSKFAVTPAHPPEHPEHEGIIGNQPAIIMPIQPYPISPPLPDLPCLKPRRRKSRTPWRKAERGW